jgi:peptide deformylase
MARCILHEIDHMDGILFIDHLVEDVVEALKKEKGES